MRKDYANRFNVTTENPEQARIPALDGLRGLAILLVLIWHYTIECKILRFHNSRSLGPFVKLVSLTWSGVDLFFVLSGFLLGGILLRHVNSNVLFKTFYIRRACRILPLYFLWVLILVAANAASLSRIWPQVGLTFSEPIPIWFHLTFTQNFAMCVKDTFGSPWLGATWSLAVEEQFYLFLPLLIRFTPLKRLPLLLICLILVAPVFRMVVGDMTSQYVLMPSRCDALLIGVFVAWLTQQTKFLAYVREESQLVRYIFLTLALGVGVMIACGYDLWITTDHGLTWLALFYGSLVFMAATNESGLIHWICTRKWLRQLGLISFGVYIFHGGIDSLVYDFLKPTTGLPRAGLLGIIVPFSLGITLFVAALSYRFFEGPILRIGHRHGW